MATKDWKKLQWNNTLSEGGMMWANSKKGGMVFISKSWTRFKSWLSNSAEEI